MASSRNRVGSGTVVSADRHPVQRQRQAANDGIAIGNRVERAQIGCTAHGEDLAVIGMNGKDLLLGLAQHHAMLLGGMAQRQQEIVIEARLHPFAGGGEDRIEADTLAPPSTTAVSTVAICCVQKAWGSSLKGARFSVSSSMATTATGISQDRS